MNVPKVTYGGFDWGVLSDLVQQEFYHLNGEHYTYSSPKQVVVYPDTPGEIRLPDSLEFMASMTGVANGVQFWVELQLSEHESISSKYDATEMGSVFMPFPISYTVEKDTLLSVSLSKDTLGTLTVLGGDLGG
jgi:hypothetical protein